VGLKDIVDTADMPTESGSALHAGRRPLEDATVTALLRRAGAVILGKTVTTEMALSAPGKTTNPHDSRRTPGGSSSGSAAAVAANMVPLAVGSQTGGSVIRPASFCGVFGYKPTFGSISRLGVTMLSRRLDHVGVYARAPEDLALIGDALMVFDPADWDMRARPGQDLVAAMAEKSGRDPRFAFVRTPAWDAAEGDMAERLLGFAGGLGDACAEVTMEGVLGDIVETHRLVMHASLAASLGEAMEKTPDKLRDETKRRVEQGLAVTAADYIRALGLAQAQAQAVDGLFEHYDILLAPAAAGEAPLHPAEGTGNPIFNGMWTLLGVPAVSVPLLEGAGGLPIGVQVIGRRGADASVLRAARWLWERHGDGA